jgi:hypothetical protein
MAGNTKIAHTLYCGPSGPFADPMEVQRAITELQTALEQTAYTDKGRAQVEGLIKTLQRELERFSNNKQSGN